MTLDEILLILSREVPMLAQTAPGATGTPLLTGRLWSSIKYEQLSPYSWRLYVDEGNMTLEEWESDPDAAEKHPMGFAPYAGKVNERDHYWTRIGYYSGQRLAAALKSTGRLYNMPEKTEG